MTEITEKLIQEADHRLNRKFRMIDFFHCNYKVVCDRIVFEIIDFALNFVDINCEEDNIDKGPFNIKFNKDIIIPKHVTECTFDDDTATLTINNNDYHLVDTDLVYFVGDVNVSLEQALSNVMSRFCEYVLKTYK